MSHPMPALADLEPMLVDGAWRAREDAERIAVLDPATGDALAAVAQASSDEVEQAVAAAARAHADGRWRGLPPMERTRVLQRIADRIEAELEELAVLETLDNGKPIERSRHDVGFGASTFRHYAGAPSRLTGRVIPSAPGTHLFTRREPVGVVALVLPWNFPFMIAAWKLAPALAAGATVVVKPAEQTPLTMLRLARICEEAGVPPGVVNVLTGDGRVGAQLVEDPRVAKVSFTGSTSVGRAVMAAAAPTTKRLTLELGGKSANVVFADADLDAAVPQLTRAAFGHSGQMCTAASRVLVHASIADELAERLRVAVPAVPMGNGLDGGISVGPLVSEEQRAQVLAYVEAGKAEGAALLAGGTAPDRSGFFVEPTLFGGLRADMRIAREEIFGPVMGLMAFEDDEEALALANDTTYGLAAGIWTRDLARAHRMAAEVRAGMVWVNTYNQFDPALPFGGVGDSGFGRDLGDEAVESFTEVKSVTIAL